ncbi:hypothetical protein ACVJGD_005200 [Bradyrhizobium sp. USDA 10063]
MGKPLRSLALTTWMAVLPFVGMPNAQAKQQCSAAMPSNPHGQWWSYRLIDGRKCWYAGKPMLSKALLEWPKEAPAKAGSAEVGGVLAAKPGDPLDAQEVALKDSDTFEARWRDRISICRACN